MEIYKVLKKQSCELNFTAKSKEDCLKKISKYMAKSVKEIGYQQIFEALRAREETGSTGFENGVAIPHAKIAGLKEFSVAIMVSKKGIDFNSVDKRKSYLFFVIIGPDDKPREHLQILAQISRFSRNKSALKELLSVRNTDALIESFYRYTTESIQPAQKQEKQKLFLMVLNELRFFDDILEIFLGKGITGVNVIDSSGAKNQLSDIPLFADFLNFLGERTDNRKTIMAVLPASEIVEITKNIEEVMGDLDKHSGALIMALDIPYIKGTLVA
jgi:mannitol/fructose-specific phosphotransferase system IIA component (Ntr-type)